MTIHERDREGGRGKGCILTHVDTWDGIDEQVSDS